LAINFSHLRDMLAFPVGCAIYLTLTSFMAILHLEGCIKLVPVFQSDKPLRRRFCEHIPVITRMYLPQYGCNTPDRRVWLGCSSMSHLAG
jgi:hypothetical protein